MLEIYNNIPAIAAGPVTLVPNGRKTFISLRANDWGNTRVNIQTYNANDRQPFKLWSIPASPICQNVDINLGYIGAGLLIYFTVENADAATTELLVNAFLAGDYSKDDKVRIIKHV